MILLHIYGYFLQVLHIYKKNNFFFKDFTYLDDHSDSAGSIIEQSHFSSGTCSQMYGILKINNNSWNYIFMPGFTLNVQVYLLIIKKMYLIEF